MSGRQPKLGLFALLACLGVTWASALSFAQEDTVPDKPTLKVRMTPTTPYLQEEILQVIRVVSPHPFEELVLDLPPVEGAETITLQQPKNRKFETYGGEGFIYETSRAIFPKQSGELRIPPVRISGSVGVSRNEKKPFVLREDAAILDVRPSPDAFSEDWWLVASDVAIVEATLWDACTVSADVPEGIRPGETHSISVFPNPCRTEAEILLRISTAVSDYARVRILDIAGRSIRDFGTLPFSRDPRPLTWDLRDQSGRDVASGIYLVLADTAEGTALRTTALVLR